MIEAIGNLNSNDALGILSRAALSLEDKSNPASFALLNDELEIRKKVVDELRSRLGLGEFDNSDAAISALVDEIDKEAENVLPFNTRETVLRGLAGAGKLPSDLYYIQVIEQVVDLYKRRWADEELLIVDVIRRADLEFHTGGDDDTASSFSIFAKSFASNFPLRNFLMVVAAERSALNLVVHQAWHIYGNTIDLKSGNDLIGVLNQFVQKFGVDFSIDGEVQRFVYNRLSRTGNLKVNFPFKPASDGSRPNPFYVSFFRTQHAGGEYSTSLIVAVDKKKYFEELNRHGWMEEVRLLGKNLNSRYRGKQQEGDALLPIINGKKFKLTQTGIREG